MYIIILLFIYGLIIGSFLNVCILRLPEGESIITDRSHCTKCGQSIKWYDLIPVVSYLILGGKCRHCKDKISIQYPSVELLNGVAYLWIYSVYGISLHTVLYCLLVSALITISLIDIKYYIIPDQVNIVILILGLINLIVDYNNWLLYVIGFFAVSSILYIIAILTKGQMGGGDIKLMAVCGLLLGWQNILLALMIGSIVGSVIGVILLVTKKSGRKVPFGPYLAIGVIIAGLYGNQIIEWYLGLFLI